MKTHEWGRGRLRIAALLAGAATALLALVMFAVSDDEILLLFVCFYTVALVACGSLVSMRKSLWWARAGMAAAIGGLLCGPPMTWNWSLFPFDDFEGPFGYCFFSTAFFGYAAFATALPLRGRWMRRLRWGAVGSCGFFVVTLTIETMHSPNWNVLSPAVNISAGLTVALALFLPVLALWKNRWQSESLESTGGSIELACPRCGEEQAISLRKDRCRKCRLVIAVDVREPRCAACGFLLYRVPGEQCPECGREIPPDDLWRGLA